MDPLNGNGFGAYMLSLTLINYKVVLLLKSDVSP